MILINRLSWLGIGQKILVGIRSCHSLPLGCFKEKLSSLFFMYVIMMPLNIFEKFAKKKVHHSHGRFTK